MNRENIFGKKLLAITIAGAMMAPAIADENQQSANTNQAQQGQQSQSADFQGMDTDQDELLVWREIHVVMDPRLVAANLDQEQIFSQYDANNDDALDEQEFNEFISGLEQEEIASAGRQTESSGETLGASGNQQASNNARNSRDAQAQSEAQHGADQATALPEGGRYNPGVTSQSTPNRDMPQESEFGDAQSTSETQYLSRGSETAATQDSQSMQSERGQRDEYTATTDAAGDYEREDGAATRERLSGRDNQSESGLAGTAAQSQGQSASREQSQELSSAPISSLEEKTVTNAMGEEIGQVKNVVANPDKGEVGFVVSSGGIMGIGSKKILAPADELSLSENNIVWDTNKGKKELKQDAKYRSDEYVEISDQFGSINEFHQAGLSQR